MRGACRIHLTDINSTSTSTVSVVPTPGCITTAYTAPVIQAGPTSTYYSLTTYTSSVYDCHGCENIIVLPYGHIFVVRLLNRRPHFPLLRSKPPSVTAAHDQSVQEATFTATATAADPTTVTIARCSPSTV